MNEPSTISTIAVAYALLSVGTNSDESPIMRIRCADAAREYGMEDTARQIDQSLEHAASVRV